MCLCVCLCACVRVCVRACVCVTDIDTHRGALHQLLFQEITATRRKTNNVKKKKWQKLTLWANSTTAVQQKQTFPHTNTLGLSKTCCLLLTKLLPCIRCLPRTSAVKHQKSAPAVLLRGLQQKTLTFQNRENAKGLNYKVWGWSAEDPNTWKVQKNAVDSGKTQHANFRGNPLWSVEV